MLRIQELPDDVYSISGDTTEYKKLDELPEGVRRKLELLRACDMRTKLDNIGWRVGATTYWLYEEKDDTGKVDSQAKLHMFMNTTVIIKRGRYIFGERNE